MTKDLRTNSISSVRDLNQYLHLTFYLQRELQGFTITFRKWLPACPTMLSIPAKTWSDTLNLNRRCKYTFILLNHNINIIWSILHINWIKHGFSQKAKSDPELTFYGTKHTFCIFIQMYPELIFILNNIKLYIIYDYMIFVNSIKKTGDIKRLFQLRGVLKYCHTLSRISSNYFEGDISHRFALSAFKYFWSLFS